MASHLAAKSALNCAHPFTGSGGDVLSRRNSASQARVQQK